MMRSGSGGFSDRLVLTVAQPLANDGGDSVITHRGAVERVRDLHRPLLVGDDDELTRLAEFLEDREQAPEVDVVERSLHLVEDIERARTGLEDGYQQRNRDERALSAGEQRQPLDLLARRPRLHFYAGGQHVMRVGESQVPLAAGEEPGENLGELTRSVFVGRCEDLLDPL